MTVLSRTLMILTLPMLLLAAPASLAQNAGEVSLTPQFKEGMEATLVLESTRKDTMMIKAMDGNSKPMENTTTSHYIATYSLRVREAAPAGTILELHLKEIQAELESPSGKGSFDSTLPRKAEDRDNVAMQAFRPCVGANIKLTLDASGHIVKVDNGNFQDARGPLGQFQNAILGVGAIKSRWNPILAPRKGVAASKVGDKWESSEQLDGAQLGMFTFKFDNDLKTVKDGVAAVDFNGKITITAQKEGEKPTFDITQQSLTGTSLFDTRDGLVREYTLIQQMNLTGAAQGLPVDRRTETTIKVTRK